MTDTETTVKPLTPEARALPPIRGTPVVLGGGGGASWLLADYVPRPGGIWDKLYDDNVIHRKYEPCDVQTAAHRLLQANYDLTNDEALELVVSVSPRSFVTAVETALFGPRQIHITWSMYARNTLRAAGIDPDTIPPEELLYQLDYLEKAGFNRVLPEAAWISSNEAKARRAGLLAGLK